MLLSIAELHRKQARLIEVVFKPVDPSIQLYRSSGIALSQQPIAQRLIRIEPNHASHIAGVEITAAGHDWIQRKLLKLTTRQSRP